MKTDVKKTIRMPLDIWKKWEAALLDPTSKQGRCLLQQRNGGYCCLGLLQKVVSGDVERSATGNSLGLPTKPWLEKHGILFMSCHRNDQLENEQPYVLFGPLWAPVTELNDERGCTFPEILEAMRPHVETY